MPKKMKVSQEDAAKIKACRKTVQEKNTDRRLYAVQLRGEGKRNKDIAEMLEADPCMVSKWVGQFLRGGISALVPTNKGGRPPRLTYEEEEALLNLFKEKAENGQIIEISEIKAAYEKLAGTSKSHAQIYECFIGTAGEKSSPETGIRKNKSGGDQCLKKMKRIVEERQTFHNSTDGKKVRLKFQDEAGFGRIILIPLTRIDKRLSEFSRRSRR